MTEPIQQSITKTHYDSKPLACGSPIIETRNGVQVRVHDGMGYWNGRCLIPPSTYPVCDHKNKPIEILGE